MSSPYVCLEKRTSVAKAVKRAPIHGTAEEAAEKLAVG